MAYRRLFLSNDAFPDTVVFDLPPAVPDLRELSRLFEDRKDVAGHVAIFVHPDVEDPEAFFSQNRDWLQDQTLEHPGAVAALGPDGVVHWGKVVPCRVTAEALIDWMADSRSKNLEFGDRPDRPPDIDTPTIRAWVRHPGEADDGHFLETEPEGTTRIDPVLIVVHQIGIPGFGRGVLKVLIRSVAHGDDEPTYIARLKAESHEGKTLFDSELVIETDDDDEDWLTPFLEKTEGRLGLLFEFDDEPMITTAADIDEQSEHFGSIEQELADYYGVPLNWRALEKVGKEDRAAGRPATEMLNAMWRKDLPNAGS